MFSSDQHTISGTWQADTSLVPRTAILLLNWQNADATLNCLASLLKLDGPTPALVVCDNGSCDDSFVRLADWGRTHYAEQCHCFTTPPTEKSCAQLPAFSLIQTGGNRGFAGGNNVGIRYVLAHECDYLWLLNNDTFVEADALQMLLAYAEVQTETALFGSTILDMQLPETVQCAGGCRYWPLLTVFRPVYGGQSWEAVRQQPMPTLDYICGASLFLRVEAMRTVGLLNEDYFLFYEELDYTHRLQRRGYGIDWCRDSRIYHQGSGTIGATTQDREKLQNATYHETLSTLKYTANWHPYLLPVVIPLRLSLKLLVLTVRRHFYLFMAVFRGYADFLTWYWKKWF